jgi:hypothetical protein
MADGKLLMADGDLKERDCRLPTATADLKERV